MNTGGSTFDVAVIGAGIVGLATAAFLLDKHPGLALLVLDKEMAVALHQSGRNSGVIHSGVYYRPGSSKAKLCLDGRTRLLAFCDSMGVPYEVCGKVIVATREHQLPSLARLEERAAANGVAVELLDRAALGALEPHTRGISALYVPGAGITDFARVCQCLARSIETHKNARLQLGSAIHAIKSRLGACLLETETGTVSAKFVVNCAGLHADRVARLAGQKLGARLVPFRGDYFVLERGAERLVNHLIYPVPDPHFPFLGVHATRTIAGHVECGPNASLALGREAYQKFHIDPTDLADALGYPGTWRLLAKHPQAAAREMRQSYSKHAFLAALQELLPAVKLEQLRPRAAGIRAQALTREGTLIDDFWIEESEQVLSVCNAPSPAATACFAIAENVGSRVLTRLNSGA